MNDEEIIMNPQFKIACEKISNMRVCSPSLETREYDQDKAYNLSLELFEKFDSHYVAYIKNDNKIVAGNKLESMYEIPRKMANSVTNTKNAYEISMLKDFEKQFMEYCFNDYAFEQGFINSEEHINHELVMIKRTKNKAQECLDKKGNLASTSSYAYGSILAFNLHNIYLDNPAHGIPLFNAYINSLRGNTKLTVDKKITIIGSSGDIIKDAEDYVDKYEEEFKYMKSVSIV